MRCLNLLGVTLACLVLCACSSPDPVRLGFLGGLSGRVADLGIEGRDGALLAVELRNKAGGVKGRQIELLSEDDQQDPDVARQAIARLIDRKVDALIGPMTSMVATAIVPLVNQAGIVMVSPTVTTNSLSGMDDHFFRVLASTSYFSKKSAKYHFEKLGIKRVAVISDLANKSYTSSWLEDYRIAFMAAGGRILDSIEFTSGDENHFVNLAQRLLKDRPDGVLILANSVDAAMLCQHLKKLNPSIQLTTSEWAATERLIELGGKAVEGTVVAQFFDRNSSLASFRTFKAVYVARFSREPGFAALTAFDATNVVLDSMESQLPGQMLKQSLLSRKTFSGAQSAIIFDAFGDTRRDTYLTTVRNGVFVGLE